MAKLYFKYGAMNSGKSTILLQSAHNYEERGMRTVIMKPFLDTKGADRVVSRLGVTRPVNYLVKADDCITEIIRHDVEEKGRLHCIFIDECQFLTVKQAEELFWIAVEMDIPVICYGLRTDFLTNGFAASARLLELAHSIEEMKTICRCGKKAMFNARMVNGKFVFHGEQVAIDNENNVEYESLCPICYLREKNKRNG
ncbi:MAG: thymidine kinase [Oscillospiraceae bacterium]|nr:thymidine kinase [Oscillospiraceae bacterium]